MSPIKERKTPIDSNYARYYEFDTSLCLICKECPGRTGKNDWSKIIKSNLGRAVHTNWKKENNNITEVFICESPSSKESSYGLPSVGTTGQAIYRSVFGVKNLGDFWLDQLDTRTYRTNIVRCQADSGLQKRVNTSIKNARVKSAFDYCKTHLEIEITNILKDSTGTINFYLAAGQSFSKETSFVEATIKRKQNELKMSSRNIKILTQDHPSAPSSPEP